MDTPLTADDLFSLTFRELMGACRLTGIGLTVPFEIRSGGMESLVQHILDYGPPELLEYLRNLVRESQQSRKRKAPQDFSDPRGNDDGTRRRIIPYQPIIPQSDPTAFGRIPVAEQVQQCYEEFYDATSQDALQEAICGVCGRRRSIKEALVTERRLDTLPHLSRLRPLYPHPKHDLHENLLLEVQGLFVKDHTWWIRICGSCFTELDSVDNLSLPPKHSLANNLWIGEIPPELQDLTITEQMLLALILPRIYVYKLFPAGQGPGPNATQQGLRGTVTSYELDNRGFTDAIEGNLLPRPLKTLSKVISITIVGHGILKKSRLLPIFRVRRTRLHGALVWMKENNSKYFGDIVINDHLLESLPDDDLPNEIAALVRQAQDVSTVTQEEGGYVSASFMDGIHSHFDSSDTPSIIPLDVSGAQTVDLGHLSASEIALQGLVNAWTENSEGGYAVRPGTEPARDFGLLDSTNENPDTHLNYWEKAFPTLFPYGRGGPEGARQNVLSLRQHLQWLLEYHDRRFRLHQTLPFVGFSILQRRESLIAARVHVQRQHFHQDAASFRRITLADLAQAQREEEQRIPLTNPDVRRLLTRVQGSTRHVTGSDGARYSRRNNIWSTNVYLAPANLFGTSNLADVNNPIVQIFAGKDINFDTFNLEDIPGNQARLETVSKDPYACARFHHFMISAIFRTLFQINVQRNTVESGMGMLGEVAAYIGLWESQNRGSLHLHWLIWLKNAPSYDTMISMLESEEFRTRLKDYIAANIRAYLPGFESKEAVEAVIAHPEIAVSRMPDPRKPGFEEECRRVEEAVVKAEQVHVCQRGRCLINDGQGGTKCKRHAPFECHEEDFVDENGRWGPKRLYDLMVEWNPAITRATQSNNNIKLLTNGRDTLNLSFYMTLYPAKKQGKEFNRTAVLTQGYAYHEAREVGQAHDIRREQSLLLFRLLHAMNRQQQLSSQMVISYLMGVGI